VGVYGSVGKSANFNQSFPVKFLNEISHIALAHGGIDVILYQEPLT
jgi:hypothetical protein